MSDIVERLRGYIQSRGGPAKDEDGKPVGTVWPMMLEAADEIERLRDHIKFLEGKSQADFVEMKAINQGLRNQLEGRSYPISQADQS